MKLFDLIRRLKNRRDREYVEESLEDQYRLWRKIDNAINDTPMSLLHEVAENPYAPNLDRTRARAQLYGQSGGQTMPEPSLRQTVMAWVRGTWHK
jgi:hypothetical protein